MWMIKYKLLQVSTVVGSMILDGGLMCSALLHSVCDLKTAQMNVPYSQMQELCRFKMGHDAAKATKNSWCMKNEGKVITEQ